MSKKTDQKKKLLVYANYYYPELASTAQLCTDICEGLKDTFDITVICTVPCYTGTIPQEYRKKKYYREEYNGVKVIRVRVPDVDKHSKKSRVKHILAYFFRSVWATFKAPGADLIFAISQPPVLGGMLGVIGKRINLFFRFRRAKYIYNIQDYNPEQTIAVGYSKNKAVLKAMMAFDKHSCKVADKVIVVGSDMVETMKKRFTKRNGTLSKAMPETEFINNWMDHTQIYPLPREHEKVAAFKQKYGLENKLVIMYSGNIGLYYDLENIMRVIGKFKDDSEVVFPFVGDGTLKQTLQEYVQEQGLKNVVFIPYQAKEELIYSLNAADVLWVVNAKGIKGISCPSKLYGVLAVSKPVLGVLEEGTEARNIVEKTQCGKVVSPGDYDGIERIIRELIAENPDILSEQGTRGYHYMLENLTKDISVAKYKKALEALVIAKRQEKNSCGHEGKTI